MKQHKFIYMKIHSYKSMSLSIRLQMNLILKIIEVL